MLFVLNHIEDKCYFSAVYAESDSMLSLPMENFGVEETEEESVVFAMIEVYDETIDDIDYLLFTPCDIDEVSILYMQSHSLACRA